MVRYMRLVMLLALLGVRQAAAESGTSFVLAGLTGYDGTRTFKVVSTNAFAELVRDARLDNEALPKAYASLRKAWRDAHARENDNKKQKAAGRDESFPIACPAPREVRQLGVFPTAEAADKDLKAREAQEAERVKRAEAEKSRPAAPPPANTGLKRPPVQAPRNRAQEPDPALQQSTLKALVEEIAVVRQEMQASRDAPPAVAAPAVHGGASSPHGAKKK